jgi:hypothetical protein
MLSVNELATFFVSNDAADECVIVFEDGNVKR